MSISSLYHDPTVPANIIERYKLAYLMQFFVQHKQRFKFPRVRLQDLYKLLETPDTRALSYLIVQILRFLKVPNATISTVDKALDIFTCEKRTSTRVGTHQLRANRQISELGAENKAKLLENLIETVYDELPDFNFAPNGFNSGNNSSSANSHPFGGGNKSMNDIKQEESVDDSMNELAIKAGSDSRGSSYVYLDDLRLYREKPQSSLSTQWDVVVGPTIDQWHNFIRSLGNNDEEGDLKAFLKDHLLEIVCTSLDSGELTQDNPELNISYLLSREQAEFNGPVDYYSVGPNQSSSCSNKLYDINDSGGGGGSGSSGEMACLDPSVAGISIKQEMPETPESYSGPYMNTGMMPQNQQMIPRSNSYPGSQIPMASPLYGSVSSPTQSVHGGPLTPSGDNILNKTSPRISSGQSREQRIDNSNMPMSYSQSQQNIYHQTQSQHVQDPMANGHIRYQAPHRFPCPSNGSMVMIGNSPNIPQAGTPQVMVFTTQMANDAALEHVRHRTPLYQFHNIHPAVSDFIQLQCNPSRMMNLQKPFENLTQKQLENRKNKMAKLEQIQSTLSKTKSQNTPNPSNITQTSSVSTAASGVTHDLHQGPPSAGHMLSSGGAGGPEPGIQGSEHSLQDLGQPMTNTVTPMLSEGPCQFPNDQPLQGQYHFNPNSQMSSIEQQMMVGDSSNPPTSEAALRQWELLRLEYMREKQTHDVMSNRFQAVDIGPYSNGSGSGSQAIMPTNMPVGSSMMAGHRPNVIRQPFPPHNLPMEQPPGVLYPAGAAAGVKRPYQLIGAPPPPGYHTNPLYHHHHDSIMNQRALLMQQQQPLGPPICDPSWNMVHQNYPHMVPNHHPMHQNFANMYPNHRGPTPPVALGINNGPLSSGQNVSSNSSTTTTTSTSSKSKSKKRKSTAKSSSSVANSSTSTTTTTSTSMSSSSAPHCSADVKPQPAAPSMTSEAQNQRFVTPMMGLGIHDDQNAISRSIPNFQDSSMNGPVASRTPLPENQNLPNSSQVKHDLISPHKSSFSPHSDMKSSGSLNSSNHMNSLSMSSNNNFPSNSSNPITAYCSSSTSSPSQNLTSASLASLARLSSQMSGGSDSPLFNSLQSQPTAHSSSSSSNPLSSKMGSNNLIHSIQPQQIQDPQMSLHQMPQQSGNGPYSSQYAQYRHMSNPMLTQTQQQQQFQHNTVIQSHEGQNRQPKSNQSSMMSIQPSASANNFVPGHPVQVQVPQSAHPSFQGSNDAMFSSYQSYPSQQLPINTSNPGNNPSNSPANGNTNLVPGVPVPNGPQQPPSIMVNNTFVNAQLNVQQMNYQHLAAPNVNAQMQIQQQHQSIQPPALMNLETNSKHSSEMSNLGTPISISQSNTSSEPNLNQAASMGLGSNSSNVPQSGNSGYMNSSLVQIQSKTPHTIQYLPADPVIGAPQGASGTHQGDILGCQSKYSSITTQPLELDELLSTQNKQMMFQPHNHDLSTGVMSNVHSNNIMMMGQQQMESQQYRFQQHQQQIRLRAAPPQGTMIMRQSQQQQQHLVLQQSFPGGNGGAMLDQQMKQQQIQRFMMVNNNQLCQQQQQQHMMMSGQLPGGTHSHYMAMESANSQEQQHLYHQQQFIAIQQQQQQQIRQQTQGHHFG